MHHKHTVWVHAGCSRLPFTASTSTEEVVIRGDALGAIQRTATINHRLFDQIEFAKFHISAFITKKLDSSLKNAYSYLKLEYYN